jgi:hypothetical protein
MHCSYNEHGLADIFFFCLSVWGGPESLGIFVSSP